MKLVVRPRKPAPCEGVHAHSAGLVTPRGWAQIWNRHCRALEQQRMEELFEKLQRKQEAAAKFEGERRREAAAKEQANKMRLIGKQSLLEEKKRKEAMRSEQLSAQIDRRLQNAAERRQRCLELITDRTAPGGVAQTSGCDTLLQAAAGLTQREYWALSLIQQWMSDAQHLDEGCQCLPPCDLSSRHGRGPAAWLQCNMELRAHANC
jgi:hypothetical protein